jgi:hypothetical protein
MKPYIYIILFVTTIGALVSCHTTNKHQDSSPYDSSNVAPAGKDSNSTRPPADIDSLEHPQEFKRWLIKYKDWVKNDQIDSLAAHTHFPIHGAGNTNWFKEAYPHIYTTHVKAVVSRQRLNRIFRNGQGAMFGDGTVWFIEKGGKFWVNQING